MDYTAGSCPNAERLHLKEIIISEHIRLPNKMEDMKDILGALEKIVKE